VSATGQGGGLQHPRESSREHSFALVSPQQRKWFVFSFNATKASTSAVLTFLNRLEQPARRDRRSFHQLGLLDGFLQQHYSARPAYAVRCPWLH
jgi:hypothetical protein